jgi:hypothetical protein
MKLSVFIFLLIPFSSLAQQDSIARVRKPVLVYLIGEHYRAVSLDSSLRECTLQKHELKFQIENYKKLILSHKQDSILADSLLRVEKSTSLSWESSYKLEKKDHKATRRQVNKWKLIALIATGIGLYGLISN